MEQTHLNMRYLNRSMTTLNILMNDCLVILFCDSRWKSTSQALSSRTRSYSGQPVRILYRPYDKPSFSRRHSYEIVNPFIKSPGEPRIPKTLAKKWLNSRVVPDRSVQVVEAASWSPEGPACTSIMDIGYSLCLKGWLYFFNGFSNSTEGIKDIFPRYCNLVTDFPTIFSVSFILLINNPRLMDN